jgi:hypothetical protein
MLANCVLALIAASYAAVDVINSTRTVDKN